MPVSVINTPESVYASYLASKREKRDQELHREGRLQRNLGQVGRLAEAYQTYGANRRDRELLEELGAVSPQQSGGGGFLGGLANRFKSSRPLSPLETLMAKSKLEQQAAAAERANPDPKDKAQAAYYNAMAQYVQGGKTNPAVQSVLQQALQSSLPGGVPAMPQPGVDPNAGSVPGAPDPQLVMQAQAMGAVGYDTDTGQFVDANGNPVM